LLSPLGAVARGILAAAVGTAAMDALWYARYRKDGGQSPLLEWEFHVPESWEKAPVPAQVGRRLTEGFLGRPLPQAAIGPMTMSMHWGYGSFWGSLFGMLAGSAHGGSLLMGPLFGAGVWATDYAVLPLGGFYKPIWQYDAKTLWQDLSAHLLFGSATGAVFSVLKRL
jgi:hypothetical protein